MNGGDPFALARFHAAQAENYDQALAELVAGRKDSHWIWYIFPQIAGLGFSPMAHHYAIADLDEARAYLADPMLGSRLVASVEAALSHKGLSALAIFGEVDAMKFRSSLTLFAAAAPEEPVFQRALEQFYDGLADPLTLAKL